VKYKTILADPPWTWWYVWGNEVESDVEISVPSERKGAA
jgi:hypothetical protein